MEKIDLLPEVKAFLDLIKKTRLRKNLSHQQLADLAGIHRSTVSLLESHRRNPTMQISFKIAKALGIKLADLVRKIEK